MFAGVVAPLFGCFYSPGTPSPRAAFCSILSGVIVRVVLEFALPKDGFLILPYKDDEFKTYGGAASSLFPTFFDESEEDLWNPSVEQCNSGRYKDYTGVDSLAAFLCSALVFVLVTVMEGDKPLFDFKGLRPYEKQLAHSPDDKLMKEIDETAKTKIPEDTEYDSPDEAVA